MGRTYKDQKSYNKRHKIDDEDYKQKKSNHKNKRNISEQEYDFYNEYQFNDINNIEYESTIDEDEDDSGFER